MTPWRNDREPRWAAAAAVATALLAGLGWFLPASWIEWFLHRDFGAPPPALHLPIADASPLRLIDPSLLPPSRPSAEPRLDLRLPVRERLVERVAPEPDEESPAGAARVEWSWDPTSAYGVREELSAGALAPDRPDSVAQTAYLLRALTLTDLDRALAMLDTTQSALAREQFRFVDEWVRAHWAGLWNAQGDGARRAAIYERAVLEAERDRQ